MKEQFIQLRNLGMPVEEAMLFVRSIAESWYIKGKQSWEDANEPADPFDTQFSRALGIHGQENTKK